MEASHISRFLPPQYQTKSSLIALTNTRHDVLHKKDKFDIVPLSGTFHKTFFCLYRFHNHIESYTQTLKNLYHDFQYDSSSRSSLTQRFWLSRSDENDSPQRPSSIYYLSEHHHY